MRSIECKTRGAKTRKVRGLFKETRVSTIEELGEGRIKAILREVGRFRVCS
jgi:hypothetical protein